MNPDDPDMTRDYMCTADYREHIQRVLSWSRRRDTKPKEYGSSNDSLCGFTHGANKVTQGIFYSLIKFQRNGEVEEYGQSKPE